MDLRVVISSTAKSFEENKKAAASGRGRARWICRVFNTCDKYETLAL